MSTADIGTLHRTATGFEGRLARRFGREAERPMRWELAPAGAGATPTLTLQIPASEDAAKAGAGLEGHLDMLETAWEGVPIECPFQRFPTARSAHGAQLTR
ncbi:MAG: hypothetical protein JSR16_07480 [Proteobacteria bacterium]|nr:hypothetical protein [Pseudomonadota bacterium]MBS0301993.1 hypothetical protein [Pseudomonadota bacterium]